MFADEQPKTPPTDSVTTDAPAPAPAVQQPEIEKPKRELTDEEKEAAARAAKYARRGRPNA